MSRQMEERSRILDEMKNRYGEDDPMVSEWMDYLEARASFDFLYPGYRPAHHRFGGALEAKSFKFQTSARDVSPLPKQELRHW
jgi:hypothetical protein